MLCTSDSHRHRLIAHHVEYVRLCCGLFVGMAAAAPPTPRPRHPPHRALQSCPRPGIGGSPLTLRPHSYRALQSGLSLGSGGLPPIPRPPTPGSAVLSQSWDLGVPLLHPGPPPPDTRFCSPVSVLGSGGSLTTPRLPPTPGSAVLFQSWDLGGSPPTPRHPPHHALQSCLSPGTWGFSSNTQAPLHWPLSQS